MSVQLEGLAILDIDSGKRILGQKPKTRQVYKESPIKVEVEGGQPVIEGYDTTVSLSGLTTKTDKATADALLGKTVMVSGYTSGGLVLQGSGVLSKDGEAILVKATGSHGYDEEGRSKAGMTLSKSMLSLYKDHAGWINTKDACRKSALFPFREQLITLEGTAKSNGELYIEVLDKDMNVIDESMLRSIVIPRHCSKIKTLMSMVLPAKTAYIQVVKEPTLDIEDLHIWIQAE